MGFDETTGETLPDADRMKNTPYKWYPWNAKYCSHELREDACNTKHALRMETAELPENSQGAGIRQQVSLPLHRENRYNLSFYAKDATAPIVVIVRDKSEKKTLCKKIIETPTKEGWNNISCTLEFEKSEKSQGNVHWFYIGLNEKGSVLIDQVCLFPGDAIEGFDPEVTRLLKEQGIRLLRFPGGNYVSGYHWKDDAVPLDKRPTMKNPAWDRDDPHHVGTDEHIRLCRLIGAEPLICVNAGNGTPEEAADWVEYCNGGADTKWGRVRADLGHPEPYNVRVWEIGNELWGSWQIGNCDSAEYARRYRAFYEAMKARDPSIYLIATGNPTGSYPDWNDVLIRDCPDILDSLTLHFLCSNNENSSPESAFLSHMGYSWLFEKHFFRMLHEKGVKAGIDLKVAITEEMIYNGRAYHPRPETLAEALYYAGTLMSAIRTEGIVEIFTHSAILNHGGNMKKEKARVFCEPVYYALQELQRLAGTRPVRFSMECPFGDIPEWPEEWAGTERGKFPLVDMMPLLGEDRLDIILVNRSPDKTIPVRIKIAGGKFDKKARVYELGGKSFLAMNDLRHPDRVKPRIKERIQNNPNDFVFPAGASSLYVLSMTVEK
jgi:alpha-N-arabinofuranosidase